MTDLQILKSNQSFVSDKLLAHMDAIVPKMGFKTEGSESLFFAAMHAAIEATSFRPFIAFEIGTATGLTTRAMQHYVEPHFWDSNVIECQWKVVSCDLPNGWSLNIDQLRRNLPDGSTIDASESFQEPVLSRVTVYLSPSEKVLGSGVVPRINFAFIDGCHCYQCVMKDFLNVGKILITNGVIVFHDTGSAIQSLGISKHGQDMIYVRDALKDILNVFGDGFELLANLEADEKQNGMMIVRKR